MNAKNNSKEVIRQEIKIINARIKEKEMDYDEMKMLAVKLYDELNRLKQIRQSLEYQLNQEQ